MSLSIKKYYIYDFLKKQEKSIEFNIIPYKRNLQMMPPNPNLGNSWLLIINTLQKAKNMKLDPAIS